MATKAKQTENQATEDVKAKYEVVEELIEDDFLESDEQNIDSEYVKVYFAKPIIKDAAYFQYSYKVGNTKKIDTCTTHQTLDGTVKKIELDSYVYENRTIKTYKIYIEKEKQGQKALFILNISLENNIGKSIMNSLLGCNKPINKILLTLYIKNSYTAIKVLINGERANWLYSFEEQNKYVETIFNKKGEKVSVDWSDYVDLLYDKARQQLPIWFPNQQHIKFVDDNDNSDEADDILNSEATFGESDEVDNYFDIDENK